MKTSRSENLDLIILEPQTFRDNRGYFLEVFQAERYRHLGIPDRFIQDNLSISTRGVLRGLHYQLGRPQGKLVWVVQGEVFDVSVDIRRGSPTYGCYDGVVLSSNNYRQVYIPEGFAHGFCVLSEMAILMYKCTDYYDPREERGIRWDDPTLNIVWPFTEPVLSEKDKSFPVLGDMALDQFPRYAVAG